MANEKRERQKSQRQARLDAEKRAEAAAKRKRQIIKWVSIIGAALVAAFIYSALSGDGGDDEVTEAQSDDERCPATDGSSPRQVQFDAPPVTCVDLDRIYVATIRTSGGDVEVALDPRLDSQKTNNSINNFIFLARFGAYDNTGVHEVIDGASVHLGDVQGLNGEGDAGYRFRGNFPPESFDFRVGSVAMENDGDPSSNGSRFFVVVGDDGVSAATAARPSPIGHVLSGLDVMAALSSADADSVTIESIDVRVATSDEVDAYDDATG